MKHLDIVNIYRLNLYQILNMFWVKTNSIPETLQNKFKIIEQLFSKIQWIQFQRAKYFT